MEVSFNQGQSWELANIQQIEKPTQYGRYWCWIFWDLEVEVGRIAGCSAGVVPRMGRGPEHAA